MIRNLQKIIFLYLIPFWSILKFLKPGIQYNALISIAVFLSIVYLVNYNNKIVEEKKHKIFFSISAILLSLFIVIGYSIKMNYENFSYNILSDLFMIVFKLYGVYIFIYHLIRKLYYEIKAFIKANEKNHYKNNKYLFLIFFLIIFLSYIPYFISFYPGLLSPDSINQISQALGLIELSNHHPVLHTMIIKLFVTLGIKIKSLNFGIALYSLFQIIVMSCVFSYAINYMIKRKVNKFFVIFSLCFYCIIPTFGFFSVTMWKDVLYGVGSLLLFIQLHKFIKNNNYSLSDKILLFISIMWVGLFRTNGLYAVFVTVAFIAFMYRKNIKRIFIFVVPVILSFLIVNVVYPSLNIKKTEFTENIGIMIKQVYGLAYENMPIDSNDLDFLEELVHYKEAVNSYDPYYDGIKSNKSYNNEFLEENKIGFIEIWFKYLLRHPIIYGNVYLKSTLGFWYPEAEGYIVHKWVADKGSLDISQNNFDNLKLVEYFDKWYSNPLLKVLVNNAVYFWFVLLLIVYSIINKKHSYLILLSFPFFVWCTLMIATPLAYQPRYNFDIYTIFPLLILIINELLIEHKKEEHNKLLK